MNAWLAGQPASLRSGNVVSHVGLFSLTTGENIMKIDLDSNGARIAAGVFLVGLYAFIGIALYACTL